MYIVQSQVKAAVRRFSPLSPSLFEICNCSHSRNYQLYASCTSTPSTRHSADEHNVCGDCSAVSHRWCGIQNHSLFFLEV